MRQTWHLISTILNKGNKDITSESFVCDGQKITDKYLIEEKSNDFFVNVDSQLASNIISGSKLFFSYL
jgi:hypothetical protein